MTNQLARTPPEALVPIYEFVLDLDDERSPCPEGCGGLTEDPYGGPCKRCWSAISDNPEMA